MLRAGLSPSQRGVSGRKGQGQISFEKETLVVGRRMLIIYSVLSGNLLGNGLPS